MLVTGCDTQVQVAGCGLLVHSETIDVNHQKKTFEVFKSEYFALIEKWDLMKLNWLPIRQKTER